MEVEQTSAEPLVVQYRESTPHDAENRLQAALRLIASLILADFNQEPEDDQPTTPAESVP